MSSTKVGVPNREGQDAQAPVASSPQSQTPHNHSFAKSIVHSLLSSQASEHNFRGFFNVAALILFVTNFRLVVENLLKYGILVKFGQEGLGGYLDPHLLPWIASLPVFVWASYAVERLASKGTLSATVAGWAQAANLTLLLALPLGVTHYYRASPASGIILLFTAAIFWLKMVSYALANSEYRALHAHSKPTAELVEGLSSEELVSYPANLTVPNLLYFMAAPTLCYQINYPRSPAIRWAWLAGKVAQFVFFVVLAVMMLEQFCMPLVKNSLVHFDNVNVGGIVERTMKLSIPSLYIWLIMFYAFFHLWLNILAELLRFGHRQFYLDWWNATTMDYYWRTWNIPTHHWLLRHIYYPALRRGLNKQLAAGLVFLFSAVFHELLISFPLHTFKLYFFIGMISQIPALYLGRYLKGTTLGNLIFWITFCFLGQPVGVLLYYFDYSRGTVQLPPQ